MALSPRSVNMYLMFKLPSAYFTGVRLRTVDAKQCTTSVRYRWINQNPFRSVFWAVQGMAAELSTGALVMNCIRDSGKQVSMLVANNKGSFKKKARGRIFFTCEDGDKIAETVNEALQTGEGRTCWMHSKGNDEDGDLVSEFDFEWTVKLKDRELEQEVVKKN